MMGLMNLFCINYLEQYIYITISLYEIITHIRKRNKIRLNNSALKIFCIGAGVWLYIKKTKK